MADEMMPLPDSILFTYDGVSTRTGDSGQVYRRSDLCSPQAAESVEALLAKVPKGYVWQLKRLQTGEFKFIANPTGAGGSRPDLMGVGFVPAEAIRNALSKIEGVRG